MTLVVRRLYASALAVAVVSVLLVSCGDRKQTSDEEATPTPTSEATFLNVSDIHFNPCFDSAIVPALVAADVAEWRGIFESSGDSILSSWSDGRHDTDYPLLKSALSAMKSTAPDPDLIVVPGDFLAHHFEDAFYGYSGIDPAADSAAGYPALHGFIDKTMRFLASEIDTRWPSAHLIAALGNNDSYCGDYMIQPKSPFLSMLADVWGPLLRAEDRGTFESTFRATGTYSIPSPLDSNTTLIVLNTNFLSKNFNRRTPCYCRPGDFGPENAEPGEELLTWFQEELKQAKESGRRVWIVQHIPPGLDTYEALQGKPGYSFTPEFNERYLAVIEDYAEVISAVIAGHYHMDDFRLIRNEQDRPAAFIHLVPSISPYNSNNPGFELVTFSPTTGRLIDYRAFYTNVAEPSSIADAAWNTEYRFSELYGEGEITPETLERVYDKLETDSVLQQRYLLYYPVSNSEVYTSTRSKFRAYWCSIGSATLTDYLACIGD